MTIKDIARQAGVSPSTVSRVLSGNQRISRETSDRVRGIMREMNYQPNQLARSLVSRTSNIIAAVLPEVPEKALSEPFLFDVLRGIGEEAAKRAFNMLLSTGVSPADELSAMRGLIQGGIVSGVILLTSKIEDQLAEELYSQGFPFVVLGTPTRRDEINYANNDNVRGGRAATDYLIERSCRRIAFLGASARHHVNVDRLLGWRQALAAARLPALDERIVHVEFAELYLDRARIEGMFAAPDRPDGVVAANDIQAINCMRILKEMGLRIPRDVSFIGFNNNPAGCFQNPQLTSVDLNPIELGRQMMRLLLCSIDQKGTIGHAIVPYEIIERESVR